MLFKFSTLLVVLYLIKTGESCVAPDCDRLDCGTCGNACCTYDYYFDLTTTDLNAKISADLLKGGSDDRYWLVASSDIRKYNVSADYLIQGIHTTFKRQYNDTLNFLIKPVKSDQPSKLSQLRAFSISNIDGAYCDAGQNYKNIITVVKNLGESYDERHVSGCNTIKP